MRDGQPQRAVKARWAVSSLFAATGAKRIRKKLKGLMKQMEGVLTFGFLSNFVRGGTLDIKAALSILSIKASRLPKS